MREKQRLRRTMMFIPGNNPGMMRDAHIYGSDSLMFDLEDSVSMDEKDAARMLVYNALKTIDYGTTELVVRINPLETPYGRADIEAMVCAGAHVLRMPKTETAQDVIECEKVIEEMEIKHGIPVGTTLMMAAIEGALGGMATAMAGMLIYALILGVGMGFDVDYGLAILYGAAGSAAGVFGDLCFSVIKRQTGIKDYGNLIPGHGGILDRFDSMMMVAPLIEALLVIVPFAV